MNYRFLAVMGAALVVAAGCATQNGTDMMNEATAHTVELELAAVYRTDVFDESAAEIVAFDATTGRTFFVNANDSELQILDASAQLVDRVSFDSGAANSVAIANGLIAVAVEADPAQDPGRVYFLESDGTMVSSVQVGSLPDMVALTPDGSYALVANEGEPTDDYRADPDGSVSIIDLSAGARNVTQADVTTVTFSPDDVQGDPIRIAAIATSFQADLEPEYIAVDRDGEFAYVAFQENNAIAKIAIASATVEFIKSLGYKDHSIDGNGLDASNEDGEINIQTWPVRGLYMPDAIDVVRIDGEDYILTANEGDSREYETDDFAYIDESRIGDDEIVLDPTTFPNASALREDANLGRLKILNTEGDVDGDGDYDELYIMGARSFSIWNSDLELVFDSGDTFERTIAERYPDYFNVSNDNLAFDDRSDDKGPEPEAVLVGEIHGNLYAFIGSERFGGIFVYDITVPSRAVMVDYVTTRNFSATVNGNLEYDETGFDNTGELGPEGFAFVPADQSPNGVAWLIVGSEVSGSVSFYEVR